MQLHEFSRFRPTNTAHARVFPARLIARISILAAMQRTTTGIPREARYYRWLRNSLRYCGPEEEQ